jgi:tetraacyldisaccharide 4'-kinase
MRLEPPGWWHGKRPADRLKAALLAPAGFLYGNAAKARFAFTKPYRSSLPVICVGNFTVGGAGKTPLALAIASMLQTMERKPAFLTRGYGGSLAGPHPVEPEHDNAEEVGDEPLLLARAAPTMLARRRPEGAKAIEALGADLIIMDDGFQNPSLVKDLSLIAIDAGAGFGNGLVFPAGPLRAPLHYQIKRAHAAVVIGKGTKQVTRRLGGSLPVIRARLAPYGGIEWLEGQPVFAFCGIGRPRKFFATLSECGAVLAGAEPFPDHHAFTEAEAALLIRKAAQLNAALVTTEKDWLRISAPTGPLAELKALTRPLAVRIAFRGDGELRLKALIEAMLAERARAS